MRIFLGPAGIPLAAKGLGIIEGIKKVKELGLHAMEIEFTHGIQVKNELAEKIGEESRRSGIKLSVHAPYFINLASVDPEKIKASKKRILASCEKANLMNASPVVFHPGYYGKYTPQETFEIIEQNILDIIEKIKELGWKCKIAPETTGKKTQFGSLDELIMLLKEIGTKHATICVDFAHLWARNGGKVNYKEVFEKLEELKLDHIHSHFSQIEYNEKGERRHLTFDETMKNPPVEEVAKAILESKKDITIISESPVLEVDSLKMKKIFEKLGYGFK
ncbi:MAG: TIM barrel protein [Candidatus Aenigmarchaeota archaeon]|nr:TIM barrel protein [Candidatus Aenigmarchaeota archaeon]